MLNERELRDMVLIGRAIRQATDHMFFEESEQTDQDFIDIVSGFEYRCESWVKPTKDEEREFRYPLDPIGEDE